MSLYRVKKSLEAIERNLRGDYQLFAHGGAMYLLDTKTEEILEVYTIECDGGDPDCVERNGKWYLDR